MIDLLRGKSRRFLLTRRCAKKHAIATESQKHHKANTPIAHIIIPLHWQMRREMVMLYGHPILMSDQGEFMSVSARNQLSGTVSAVAKGAVNDEVEITLPGGEKLIAIVTVQSQQSLGLVTGKEAVALIKAPWVILASEDCGLRFSARNQFAGEVSAVEQGAVNSTVHIKTDAGFKLTSVITNESLQEMALKNGARVIALVKASSVLLAVRA